MEQETLHDLVAAYALNALEPGERQAFDAHLTECARCRDDLASFEAVAASFAYVPDAPAPPEALRDRVLARAGSERTNVVPLRRRVPLQAVAAVAAVAACVAIGLGVWAASLSGSLDRTRDARRAEQRALSLAADPAASRVPLRGARGTLLVGADGQAALVVASLPSAPGGKTYEAWVLGAGLPERAGVFRGGGPVVVPLQHSVQHGEGVAVTVERNGGVSQPTMQPIFSARVPT